MTSNIFSSWLYKQDGIFTRQKRMVAFFLDNSTAYPNINSALKSIKLIFLSSNTTSITQPMDQGIIASFKSYYNRYLYNMDC